VAPLANAQAMDEVNAALQFAQITQQMGAEGAVAVKYGDMIDYLGDKLGVPQALRNSAAERSFQIEQQQAQQAQAPQLAQDPLVQIQQAELQIKGQEAQRKAQKDATDAQLKQSQQQIERERIMTPKEIDMARIQATVQKDQMELAQDAQSEKNKLMADMMRNNK
jgi:hypothetical protein